MLKIGKVLLLALAFSLAASAGAITYTLTSTGTGTLGGVAFTDAVVTVTLVGDTSTVITSIVVPPSPWLFNPGTATVNVAGLGTATFTDSIGIFSTFNDPTPTLFGVPVVAILDLSNPSDPSSGTGILGQAGPEFLGYDLVTPFGPGTGLGGPWSGSHVTPHFPTTVGDMTWAIGQALNPGASTFTAVATPEPGTLLLLVTGFAFFGGRFRQRRVTRKTS
jgi:hypothetical protein